MNSPITGPPYDNSFLYEGRSIDAFLNPWEFTVSDFLDPEADEDLLARGGLDEVELHLFGTTP